MNIASRIGRRRNGGLKSRSPLMIAIVKVLLNHTDIIKMDIFATIYIHGSRK